LLTLGVSRYVIQRFPLHYDPLYWAAVFPLGFAGLLFELRKLVTSMGR